MAFNQPECAIANFIDSREGLATGNKACLLPGKSPEVTAAKKATLECCFSKQKTAGTPNDRVVNVEERGFDFDWLLRGSRHLFSLVAGVGNTCHRLGFVNVELTLIGKPGCHLCEDALDAVNRVVADFEQRHSTASVSLTELNILHDAELAARYSEEIPVLLIDGKVHNYWRIDEARFAAALDNLVRE